VALNAPKPDEGPSGVRGNRDEAMTVRQHEPVWELDPQGVGPLGWPWTPPSPMKARAGCGGTGMRRWP